MSEKRVKSCALSVKSKDVKEGIVTFYASAFGNTSKDADSDGDVILKGAFAKTLKEQAGRIKHCLNHDVWSVPGVIIDAKEDDNGLLITSQLAKGSDGSFSQLAKDTLINYEAGVITEHSIGYRAVKEDYDEDEKCNFIKEIKLWEVSSLTGWGANQNTPFVGMKGAKDYADQLHNITTALRKKDLSREEILALRKFTRPLNQYLKSLEEKSKPVDTTLKALGADGFKFLTENFKLE